MYTPSLEMAFFPLEVAPIKVQYEVIVAASLS